MLDFDVTPLLNRICDQQLNFDLDVRYFLERCFIYVKMNTDPALCIKVARAVPIEERPTLYNTFMFRFKNGELNEAIESDFFAASTPGKAREAFVTYLSPSFDTNMRRFGGGGMGGGGMPNPTYKTQKRRTLAIQILTKAISQVINLDDAELKFDSYNEIWFDKERVIRKVKNQDGTTVWQNKYGSYENTRPPEGVQKIQGRAAVVRHLLSMLCQYLANEKLEGEDGEAVVEFVRKMTRSSRAYKEFAKTKDFEELHIERDMKALLNFAKGDTDKGDYSRFAEPDSNRGGFGGGGGVF